MGKPSLGHDVVCISAIDGLPLWYLLVMMLSVLLRLTAYPDNKGVSRQSKKYRKHHDQKIPKGLAVNRRSTDNIMTKRYQRGKSSIEEVQTAS
jgi:hypothetical protein